MKKILVVLVFLTLVASSVAFGASTRWLALGGDHRFLIDSSNYATMYPGRITSFGNAAFVIPIPKADIKEFYDQRYFTDSGITSGFLLNVKNMTLALHYGLDTDGTKNLRSALARIKPAEGAFAEALSDMQYADAGTEDWTKAKGLYEKLGQQERLGSLDLKEFPDLFWAMKMGKISLGARLAVAMDSVTDAASTVEEVIPSEGGKGAIGKETIVAKDMVASAKSIDFVFGATMYETPAGDLDLGLDIGMQSFSDDDPNSGLSVTSTGGTDIGFHARLNKPLDKEKKYTLVPLLSLVTGALPTAEYDEDSAPNVTAVSYNKGDLGVGIRKIIREKGLLLAGVVGGYNATTFAPTTTKVTPPAKEGGSPTKEKVEQDETTDTTLSATVLGGVEFPVKPWLVVRGGVYAKLSALTDEMLVKEKTEYYVKDKEKDNKTEDMVASKTSKNVDYYYNMGIRTIYNGLIIDVLLARNILHRGPYFVTGADGPWATHICVTYSF